MRLRAPGRAVERLHFYMNWGAALGTASGLLYGLNAETGGEAGRWEVVLDGLMGAAIGNLAGGVVGLAGPPPTDTTRGVSRSASRSPAPSLAAALETASAYVGLGGRVGASVGALAGAMRADNQRERGIDVLWNATIGWTAGMAVGGVTYLVRNARR